MLRDPGCSGWHGTTNANWLNDTRYGFYRGGTGMFSFRGNNNWDSNKYCGRGVAVVGTGL